MLSSTFKDYEKNYESRLLAYKKDYEDNTETSFLEIELSNYTKYYNSLKKVFHFTKTSPRNNLGYYPITSEVGLELEIINKPVFDEIISEKKADPEYDEDEFRRLLYPGKNAPSIEINIKVLNNRITSAKRILEFINKKQHSEVPGEKKNDNAYKNHVWFKVGVLFASGKMAKYYKITKDRELYFNPAFTSPRVAEDLGDIKYDKYILATIKNYEGDKNIFNYRDKMMKIISHCEEQNISVIPYFKERLPSE